MNAAQDHQKKGMTIHNGYFRFGIASIPSGGLDAVIYLFTVPDTAAAVHRGKFFLTPPF